MLKGHTITPSTSAKPLSTCSSYKAPSHFQAQKHRGLLILRALPTSLPDPAAQTVLSQLINHAWHLAASLQHSTGV